jgi:hypothetical protein
MTSTVANSQQNSEDIFCVKLPMESPKVVNLHMEGTFIAHGKDYLRFVSRMEGFLGFIVKQNVVLVGKIYQNRVLGIVLNLDPELQDIAKTPEIP